MSEDNILEINDLEVRAKTIKGVSELLRIEHMTIKRGEISGVVGESGSAKSILALTIIGLLPNNVHVERGEILFNGEDLTKKSRRELSQEYFGKQLTMIFQDPMASLNPVFTVKDQLDGVIKENNPRFSANQVTAKAIEMLDLVKLSDPEMTMSKYPHELSGGMRQRVLIAMALSAGANFLISDESTRSLDVTIQAGILQLMEELARTLNLSVLFITSNVALAAVVCSTLRILYSGEIMEAGTVSEILSNYQHPYTKAFLSCFPTPENKNKIMASVPGRMPDPLDKPMGCKFNPRCPECFEKCLSIIPELKKIQAEHYMACHLPVMES
jgi:peptide/nickel transport system ATP-binding protein